MSRRGYLISAADVQRLAEALRWVERQKANAYRNLPRRRAPLGLGAGGAGIHKAYCLTDAGSGSTIKCSLDADASGADDWDSLTSYDSGAHAAHNGIIWQSTIDDNQGNEPGVDEGWVPAEVTVHCELIGASGLSDCFPTLTAGTMMPVWFDRRDALYRSLWWFQGHEACPGVEA